MKSKSPLFSNYSIRMGKGSIAAFAHSPISTEKAAPLLSANASVKTKKAKGKAPKKAKKIPGGKKSKRPIFTKKGHVTLRSIADRREFFLGKSVARLEHELRTHGYEVTRRGSKHPHSKAKIILTMNSSRYRNIKQIQISPGSSRHGNVPYVKISTSDYGKIKIIGADRKSYKTDGNEKAIILYRRVKKK